MLLPQIPEAALWAIYASPIVSCVAIVAALRRRPLDAGRLTVLAVAVSWLLARWTRISPIAATG